MQRQFKKKKNQKENGTTWLAITCQQPGILQPSSFWRNSPNKRAMLCFAASSTSGETPPTKRKRCRVSSTALSQERVTPLQCHTPATVISITDKVAACVATRNKAHLPFRVDRPPASTPPIALHRPMDLFRYVVLKHYFQMF